MEQLYPSSRAESGLRTRELTQNLISWGMTVQSLVYAAVIVVGAPMVIDGTLTTGSVVAASMLASRMIAPMATLCGVLARWQQVKAAKEGLDSIMQLPTENQREETPIPQGRAARTLSLFEQAQFRYQPEDPRMALRINRLEIRPGEKVAILGRNGAGKSTLLQAMAGGMDLAAGELRLDNLSLPHLDVADVRRKRRLYDPERAAVLRHPAREHHPSACRAPPTKRSFEVLRRCAARPALCRSCRRGWTTRLWRTAWDCPAGSGSRFCWRGCCWRDPNIVLMDEPTASLDEHTEREFIQRLGAWLGKTGRWLSPPTACRCWSWWERVVVLKDGMLVMDAPKKRKALNNSRMQQQQQAATGRGVEK
ncbi:ATP-binding cassette domain-containing protein [Enterobacter bugandensis]|uniref:ATP-binding cassette domain-containing protein n=1 Tax=Enterobacter bugandensis TaxID=881260 RepID=UPI002019359C|nr:ATP-binding cassette domain-containing protein [Enterobacter bugandensis]UQQ29902.1 ATP-binding cassette domain-containing protein [Enterobacter bugandensis]